MVEVLDLCASEDPYDPIGEDEVCEAAWCSQYQLQALWVPRADDLCNVVQKLGVGVAIVVPAASYTSVAVSGSMLSGYV